MGLNEKDLGKYVRDHGMNSDSIPTSPESFESQLKAHGPFVYIESIPTNRLPLDLLMRAISQGSRYSHAIAITGLEQKHNFNYVHFNDPATGLRHHLEFYDFVRSQHKPLHGPEGSFVIYLIYKL